MSYQDQSELQFSSDMSSFLKIVCYLFMLVVVVGFLFLLLGCFKISSYAFDTYESIDKIPHNKVGLLLGTSSLDATGQPNEFFTYRIMAASQLFKSGKVDYILVSGDNLHKSYNEPRQMTRALIKSGVPANRIISDYAGISTLDSVIRARKVFLLKSVTIISQSFQNERALFIADNNGLNAIGYNALSPESGWFPKTAIREFFAKIKCTLDVYVLKTQPKFLGKPEIIDKEESAPKELTSKPKRMTSMLKHVTDSASVVRMREKIEKYRPFAKKISDTARMIKYRMHRAQMEAAVANDYEDVRGVDPTQVEVLNEEQKEALEQASEVASESLNAGGSSNVYIDPNMVESSKENSRKNEGGETFGDPWER